MRPRAILPLPNHEVIEHFEDAARKLRDCFRSSVAEALPGFSRRLFEQEWQDVADLQSINSIPPLAAAYLLRCERCVRDLLNKNYDGAASSYFEKCVSEAADDVRARVIASCNYERSLTAMPTKRTA
jgi:hypothetical protein